MLSAVADNSERLRINYSDLSRCELQAPDKAVKTDREGGMSRIEHLTMFSVNAMGDVNCVICFGGRSDHVVGMCVCVNEGGIPR